MEYHIFYSWQSDLKPYKTNHTFIQSSLQTALGTLEEKLGFTFYLDQATRDEMGSVDIANTIEEKIKKADYFIADISIVNPETNSRKMPNPNVMYELGIATDFVGWSNIILVYNEYYGKIEEMPFDIKCRRAIKYNLSLKKYPRYNNKKEGQRESY